jgi:hypothetical protein
MTGSAIISEDRLYRYRLTRGWNSQPPVMWIMLNPSKADHLKDDPTIRRVIGFSMNHGFGSCIVHNLFALRSTEKSNLLTHVVKSVGKENDEHIIDDAVLPDGTQKMPIICAWGTLDKRLRWRAVDVLKYLEGLTLHALKIGNLGDPAHPLYLPNTLRIQEFKK